MSYIYLVLLGDVDAPDYAYVGSHTWDGPAGQLDPNYHGSCMFKSVDGKCQWDRTCCSVWWRDTSIKYIRDVRYLMKIICTYDPRKDPGRERHEILKYAEIYGVVKQNLWAYAGMSFKKGCLLNQHASSCEATRTPEVQAKRVANTDFTGQANRLNTSEARVKSLTRDWKANMKSVAASRKRNGNCSDMRACHTPEAIAKAELRRDRVAASMKIDYKARVLKYDVALAQLSRVRTRALNAYIAAINLPKDHPQRMRRIKRIISGHPEVIKQAKETYGVTEDSELYADAARGPVTEFE